VREILFYIRATVTKCSSSRTTVMDGSKKIRVFEDFFNTLKCSKCSTGGHLSEFERASSVGSGGAGCAELAAALAPWNRGSVELFCVSAYSAHSAYLL